MGGKGRGKGKGRGNKMGNQKPNEKTCGKNVYFVFTREKNFDFVEGRKRERESLLGSSPLAR